MTRALARELGRGSQESSIFQGFAMLAQAEGDTAGAVQQWVRWSQSEETLLGERGLGLLSAEVAAALADSDPATAATMLAISDYRLARSGAILLPLTAEAIETIRAGLDPAPEAAETPHHEVTAMLQELALRPD